jgi:hypothetical protein
MDVFEDIDFEIVISAIVLGAVQDMQEQQAAQNTGLPGSIYLDELLSSSPQRIYEVLRMRKELFLAM